MYKLIYINIYVCIYTYKKQKKKSISCAANNTFIRGLIWGLARFRDQSIININSTRRSSILQYHQTLLVFIQILGMQDQASAFI